MNCVAVFGGSGFLGREIVARLIAEGVSVRVAVRNPQNVRVNEDSGQTRAGIRPVYADVRDETSVALALEGCDAAVNSVGLYTEKGSETFKAIHELGALNVARQCAIQNVERLVHVSGIGVDISSQSKYVQARAKGELLTRDAFPTAIMLRPSVLFGPGDTLINTLADLVRGSPVVPLFGHGRTKLQPVYVVDVAQAAFRALENPSSPERTYELGGRQVYTYRGLVELVAARLEKRRLYLPLPFFVWHLMAAVASLMAAPPLTRDQVVLMKRDNVVAKNALSLEDLGIRATALEEVLPRYAF
jgi:NADH dehydrogenase